MVTLGEGLSLPTPRGPIMEKWIYGFLDGWKMHLRQLLTLRC